MTESQFRRARELATKWKEKTEAIAKVQDYLGLDAAGFLLVALGHLVKAGEKLEERHPTEYVYRAKRNTQYAAELVRRALRLLDEQKEETCKKSNKSCS